MSNTENQDRNPPAALYERDVWLCWRYETRNGKQTKIPVDPLTGGMGSSTDPNSRTDYETACDFHTDAATDTDGLGFAFPEEDLLTGVDLDNVRDPDIGETEPWAEEIINKLGSYTELSPSGTGFHIVVIGMKPGDRCRTVMESTLGAFDGAELEMYDAGRFFTYTGEHVEGTPATIERRNDSLSQVYEGHLEDAVDTAEAKAAVEEKPDLDLSDEVILEKARSAENADKFIRLYDGFDGGHGGDTSKADKAFCQMLAFWSGGDHQQIDRLFRNSGRMRAKWDEDRGDQTYGQRTIEAALKDQTEFYERTHSEPIESCESVAQALVIDPDEQTITTSPMGDMDAESLADCLRQRDFPGDTNVVLDIVSELNDEKRGKFLEFWNSDGGGEWTVETAARRDGWGEVRDAYADPDVNNKPARDAAYRQLRSEHSFATLRDTEELLIYREAKGIYKEGGEAFIRNRLENQLQDQFSRKEVDEILYRVRSATYQNRDDFGGDETNPQVCVANGVLDLSGDELSFRDHRFDRLFLSRLPVEYDSDAECPNFDSFLDDVLGSNTDKQVIYEMLGYCLWPSYPFAKSLFLYGDGRNGKSTLLDVFHQLLGSENISSRGLVELEEDRFAKADLFGSMANIAGDLPNRSLDHTGTLKTLTGGDFVTADQKYKQPFNFQNRAKLIFAANDPPEIRDDSTALYRRLLLVNFPNEFTPEGKPGPDARPKHKLMEEIASETELSGILNKALSALSRLFDRGEFSQNGGVEQVRERYKTISDPIYAFVNGCLTKESGEEVPTKDVFTAYDTWAQANDAPMKSNSVLGKKIPQYTGIKSKQVRKDGDKVRVYQGLSLSQASQAVDSCP